jgi:ribosomal protein S18 acetylase RimI-like enzyme
MGSDSAGMTVRPFEPEHLAAALALWNEALGFFFPLREELLRQNALADPNYRPGDHAVALVGRRLAGFVLTKRWRVAEPGISPATGSIAAVVVAASVRRRGIGAALVAWAERRLRAAGCTRVQLGGGGFLHLLPGVPIELRSIVPFFPALGYTLGPTQYDLARDLSDYLPPPGLPEADVGPARPAERAELEAFVAREFPGLWAYTVRWLLAEGKPIDEVVVLRADGRIAGFCVTYPPEARPIGPSVAWAPALTGPVGGIGPIGVAAALRGRRLGLALLDGALRRLQAAGVRDCVVDWTDQLELYGRCGFAPWKAYLLGEKRWSAPGGAGR